MPAPAYQRIAGDMVRRITLGEFPPAARLPTEAELARHYGVARMTLRRAVDDLVRDGFVVRRQGVGIFVSADAPLAGPTRSLYPFAKLATSNDTPVRNRLISSTVVQDAPSTVSAALGVAHDAPVVRIERTRRVKDVTIGYQVSWIPLAICPKLRDGELPDCSVRKALEEVGIVLEFADHKISATNASPSIAALLGVRKGAALLFVERRACRADGRAVHFSEIFTLPELAISLRLNRGDGQYFASRNLSFASMPASQDGNEAH